MPRGGGPGGGEVVEAVPVDARGPAAQQLEAARRPQSCTSSAPNVETPTSETQTGKSVTAAISSSFSGHSSSSQWFQSIGKPCTATASSCANTPWPSQQADEVGIDRGDAAQHARQAGRLGRDGLAGERAMRAKTVQPGSFSRSQWDLLLGSFQIIAASIMSVPLPPLGQDTPRHIDHRPARRGGR